MRRSASGSSGSRTKPPPTWLSRLAVAAGAAAVLPDHGRLEARRRHRIRPPPAHLVAAARAATRVFEDWLPPRRTQCSTANSAGCGRPQRRPRRRRLRGASGVRAGESAGRAFVARVQKHRRTVQPAIVDLYHRLLGRPPFRETGDETAEPRPLARRTRTAIRPVRPLGRRAIVARRG